MSDFSPCVGKQNDCFSFCQKPARRKHGRHDSPAPKYPDDYSQKPKCIVVTPAGRRRYLEKLVKCLELQKDDFDEWHLWENTRCCITEPIILLSSRNCHNDGFLAGIEGTWITCMN